MSLGLTVTLTGTGTSQGVPVIGCNCDVCLSQNPKDQRLRTACIISSDDVTIAVDAGPDFRQQMLRAKTKRLDAVLFTHPHKDHTAGLDDTRPFFFRQRIPIDIYASEAVEEQLRCEYAYAFVSEDKKYPGAPGFNIIRLDEKAIEIENIQIQPIPLMHGRMPVFGFRIGDFAYLTDVNHIPEHSWKLLEGVDTLVLDALRHKPHHSHFTLAEAIAVAQNIGASRTWFTHISHLMGKHEDINADLPEGMALGHDGLVIQI
ncbi:MAG: MBL fold metallo-hydrolase [Bacteroidia bacterium]